MKIKSNNPLNYAITRTAVLSGIIQCERNYLERDDKNNTILVHNQDFLIIVQEGANLKSLIYDAQEQVSYATLDAALADVKTRYTTNKTGLAAEDFFLKKMLLEEAIAGGWYSSVQADWI
jgi:hypothetical protein